MHLLHLLLELRVQSLEPVGVALGRPPRLVQCTAHRADDERDDDGEAEHRLRLCWLARRRRQKQRDYDRGWRQQTCKERRPGEPRIATWAKRRIQCAGLRTEGSANRTEQVAVAERLAKAGNRAGLADEVTGSRIIPAGHQDHREG